MHLGEVRGGGQSAEAASAGEAQQRTYSPRAHGPSKHRLSFWELITLSQAFPRDPQVGSCPPLTLTAKEMVSETKEHTREKLVDEDRDGIQGEVYSSGAETVICSCFPRPQKTQASEKEVQRGSSAWRRMFCRSSFSGRSPLTTQRINLTS